MKHLLLASTIGPMTPIERAAGRYMRAPDHGEEQGGEESYRHSTNNFEGADITLSGSGAEEEKAEEKDVDKGEEDKQLEKVEGADEAGASDEDDEEGEEGDNKPPPAKDEGEQRKPRYERRIDKLTARNKELEERLETLEKGKQPEPEEQRGGKPEKAATSDKPLLADFETYEDWVDAVTDWKVEQKLAERDGKTKAAEAEKDFSKRVIEGSKRFGDWDEVVTEDVRISQPMANAIKETDDPSAVIYFLGNNPEEAKRILGLSPTKQTVEIGKIEAVIAKKESSSTDKTKKVEVSQAPEPPKPPKGSGSKTSKSVEDMDPDEYIRYMNKQRGVNLILS